MVVEVVVAVAAEEEDCLASVVISGHRGIPGVSKRAYLDFI